MDLEAQKLKWVEDNLKYINERKVYIDKELWYIPNLLSDEELSYIRTFFDDPIGWYITSRSQSIRNKFVNVKTKIHAEGTICPTRGIDLSNTSMFPEETDERFFPELFYKLGGIFDKMKAALPAVLNEDMTLQSFWPLEKDDNGGGAYEWHYEKGMSAEFNEEYNDFGMTAAWSIYLNDNFEGGTLEFVNKPYKITPIPGMLISIPMTKDFTHRVTPVTNGIRHTMYGVCYKDLLDRPVSTGETC